MTTADDRIEAPPRDRRASGWHRGDGVALAVLAAITYLPLLVTNRGRLNADTKLYLYLDPGGLWSSAADLWNDRVSGGTVTHQNIGYLWPMGPYYWLTDVLGVPDWLAQRLWMGTIMFAAAAGAYWLFRSLWQDQRGATVGAVVYGISPFVLGHITGQSALLLPFAALPWLIVAVRNALRADPWRWAAVFALVTTTAGSLNGSSIFFVLFGAVLWIPYAVWWERSASPRDGVVTLVRLAGLTVVTQLWWLVAYSVGGKYGLPILQVTETVRETSSATSAIEVLRGLGYWFFYGADNQGPWLDGIAPPFTQSLLLLAVSFAAPLACVALGWWSRFRERAFFVALVVGGLLASTVAFGTTDRSLVGTVFESMSRSSGLVLSLRNTQRAAALTALGLAGLAAAGLAALRARDIRLGRIAGVAVLAAAVLTFSSPWSTALVADRYDRPEDVPQAWLDAAAYLDRVGGRAMLVPGIDFATYRWGNTLDPVLAALTRTDLVWRELLPMGGDAGADLVGAFDQGIQEGWFDPRAVAPVARALGVTHIVVANDLENERYRITRPEIVMDALMDPASGLTLEETFNDGYVNRPPGPALVDEVELRTRYSSSTPLPQVAVFSVPGARAEPVTVYPKGSETVVHGDGAGVLAAATAGLIDEDHLPLLSGTELGSWPAARRAARGPGARHIVTDSNRKQDRRYTGLRENTGATQGADGTPESGIDTDVAAAEFTGGTDRTQSIVELAGAASIDASGYGNVISLLPEDRPTNAFDGDPRTSWRVDVPSFRPVRADDPATLTIDLGRRVRADHVDVVQPANRPGTQPIEAFDVVLDDTRVFPVTVDPATAIDPAGTRVELDGKPFTTLELRIPDLGYEGPVGIAEVAIPGVAVEEIVRMPRSLDDRGRTDRPFPLAYVLTRLRANPSEPYRMDPELSMRRSFTVPTPMEFALSGTARVNPRADDDVVDSLLGAAATGTTFTASDRLTGDLFSRASAAADGDLGTSWSTPMDRIVGERWTARADARITVPSLAIDVVVDAQHSLPTELAVTVDGSTQVFAVAPLTTTDEEGATARVVLTPERPFAGREVSVEVRSVDARTTTDPRGQERVLPVAFAEIGVPGRATADATMVATPCRDDLVTLDGAAIGVRVAGDVGTTGAAPLMLTGCDDAPLTLAAGRHVLWTAPGLTTGIDVDGLALVSPEFASAPPAAAGTAPAVLESATRSATVEGTGDPYWVRLNQSVNRGWEATARWDGGSADLGSAHSVDAFASGWSVPSGTEGPTTLRFTWPPQRTVNLALAVSGLAALVCLGLVVLRRRRAPADDEPHLPVVAPRPFSVRPAPVAAAGAVVIVGAAFGSLLVGAALLVFAVGLAFAPRLRALAIAVRCAPLAALGAGAGYVWVKQARNDYAHDQQWPAFFDAAHLLVLFGLLALALLVWADRPEDLEAGGPGSGGDPETTGTR